MEIIFTYKPRSVKNDKLYFKYLLRCVYKVIGVSGFIKCNLDTVLRV